MTHKRISAPVCALLATALGHGLVTAAPGVTAPSNVTVVGLSENRIDVSWRDNSSNETGFEIHRSLAGPDSPFSLVAALGAQRVNYNDAGLNPATQYCYKLRALRAVGGKTTYSEFSATACATTSAPSPPPPPPPPPVRSQLQITASTIGTALDTNGYSLSVWRAWRDGGGFLGVASTTLPANGSVTISGLESGNYQLRLGDIAVNCDIEGTNPRVVAVGPSPEPLSVRFDVSCAPVTQLAFADTSDGNPEIYVVNSDGTDTKRLTTHAAADVEPAWSPDGTKIAFRSDRDGADEIYVMNADGSNPERLTHSGGNSQPAWSADGTMVAFTSRRDGNAEIYVMNADGSGQVNITNHGADDEHPSWSPDGVRIAFNSTRNNPFGYPGIYVTDVAGSTLVSLSSDPYRPQSQPVWSPNGAWLAISETPYNQIIAVIDARDGAIVWWTVGPYPDCYVHSDPSWSPDSRKLAFTQTAWCDLEPRDGVHVVRVDEVSRGTSGVKIAPGFTPNWRGQ
jgi:dipeptidyl aminopeptidase/acylaminoacyl peptidase